MMINGYIMKVKTLQPSSSSCSYKAPTSASNNTPMGKIIDKNLAHEILTAIETSEIKVTLQPKVDLNTYEISGYEVLLRWTHPTYGVIPADRWIMIAETHGLMPQLTQWLINQIIELSHTTNHSTSFAINVSPSCLTYGFARSLLSSLQKKNVPSSAIEVEITESTPITNFKELSRSIDLLRENGIKVSLDDFGVGYASLQTLMELNVDEIKVDKSIVQSTRNSALAILKSIVNLATELQLSIVFEGIESQRHLNLAKSLNVHKGQGYLFGKPQEMPQSFSNLQNKISKIEFDQAS